MAPVEELVNTINGSKSKKRNSKDAERNKHLENLKNRCRAIKNTEDMSCEEEEDTTEENLP